MMNLTTLKLTVLIIVISLLSFKVAFAQQYVADSVFNGNGLAISNFYNNIDRGFGCDIQQDQKLVFVGLSKNQGTGAFELCVSRIYQDYSFDSTFSGDGKAYVSMGNQGSIGGQAPTLKIDANGRIVIVNSGTPSTGNSLDLMICRLDSNGVLDNTFNGNGVLFVDLTGGGTQPDLGSDFDFDAQGNIYITGATRTSGTPLDNDFFVVKVKDNGQLDASFDFDGKKLYNPTGFAEFGTGIRVLADNKIVFGGLAGANSMILKIDSTGTLDNTFAGIGYATVSFASSSYMYGLDLDDQERIIIVATIQTSNTSIGVARYLSNGLPDPSFGTNGKVNVTIGFGSAEPTELKVVDDNKILVSGAAEIGSNGFDYLITRIDSSGVLDLTFNGTGYYSKNFVSGVVDEFANSFLVTNSGNIFLTGTIVLGSAINEDIGLLMIKPVLNPTTISEVQSLNDIRVLSNPFDEYFQINVTKPVTVYLYNTTGKLVRSIALTSGSNLVDGSGLSAGLYLLSCTELRKSFKLIKY